MIISNLTRVLFTLLLALAGIGLRAAETNQLTEAEAAYLRVVTERAEKIVLPLGLAETEKSVRVRDIIAMQYRDLAAIHDARDAQIKAAKEKSGEEKDVVDAAVKAVRDAAQHKLDNLHSQFLAKLSSELTSAQVEQVKDGMTYGVVNGTYHVYLKMFPDLTEDQKKQIKAWLVEAREIAMDQGTSGEKHAVFGKYKGRINNYLVKAGYDLKQGEQNLRRSMQNSSNVPAN